MTDVAISDHHLTTDRTADVGLTRRSMLLGAGAAGVLGATSAAGLLTGAAPAGAAVAPRRRPLPLWRVAAHNGILYGSSTATWQISDPEYRHVFRREAAVLFTEDDLLWYRLKPTPTSPLDFTYSDQIIEFAEQRKQLVFGAHLVWDEGFGDGWTDSDLWDLNEHDARSLLYDTMRAVMGRYKHRVQIWSVVNEAIANGGKGEGVKGLRDDVPWFQTIGPEYVKHAFHVAHQADPHATLVLNDFGYETINQYGDRPVDKRHRTLNVIDRLLDAGAPVHAFGIQAHLLAEHFHRRFHENSYRQFLSDLADRGLKILITEMDVLDDVLRAAPGIRDRKVADIYRNFLDVALDEKAVKAVINFGLSDRYTWLEEDYPRDDGAHRRPLLFSRKMKKKAAYHAVKASLKHAPERHPRWRSPRL